MSKIIKQSLFAFLILYSCKSNSLVIFLNGMSSVGKTSIAKELYQMLQGDYALMQSDAYVKDYYTELQQLSYKKIHFILDDCLSMKNKHLYQCLYQCDVCFVHVYCPLTVLYEHVKKRNKLNVFLEKRSFDQILLYHFFNMYRQVLADEKPFDTISFTEFKKICEFLPKYSKNQIVDMFKNKFLYHNMIQYQLALAYDLTINTAEYNSKECAEQILQYISSTNGYGAFQKNYQ